MIEELHVKDLALIEDAVICPSRGLTVLTGETGAGKSALLSAIKLLIGERAEASQVRQGCDFLLVEAQITDEGDAQEFPDGHIVSRRVSSEGRSRCTLDGSMATVGQLSQAVGAHIDLCGQIDFIRTEAMPLLARDAHFSFACNGCGDCCRGREDIVLSGFDLWRIAARLRLPPQIVARGYCRASIGTVSHLPVLRLAPVKENRNNCPFLTGDHCAIHDAEPLVCALYPLAQEISRKGQVSYFLQPTGCGGQVIEARVEDYLARYDVPAREQTDVRWAQTCMTLEDTVEQVGAQLSPVLVRRMQDKLWQALYFGYDYAAPFLPQLEKNLHWLDAEFAKLTEYQQKRNNASK